MKIYRFGPFRFWRRRNEKENSWEACLEVRFPGRRVLELSSRFLGKEP